MLGEGKIVNSLIFLFHFLSSIPIVALSPDHIKYCRDHYADSHCGQGCNSAPCGWDGSDCFAHQSPLWAKGTLVLHTNIPLEHGAFSNSSLLWALSVLLQSPLKLRGATQLATNKNLFDFDAQQIKLLAQATPADSNGCVMSNMLQPLWLDADCVISCIWEQRSSRA